MLSNSVVSLQHQVVIWTSQFSQARLNFYNPVRIRGGGQSNCKIANCLASAPPFLLSYHLQWFFAEFFQIFVPHKNVLNHSLCASHTTWPCSCGWFNFAFAFVGAFLRDFGHTFARLWTLLPDFQLPAKSRDHQPFVQTWHLIWASPSLSLNVAHIKSAEKHIACGAFHIFN